MTWLAISTWLVRLLPRRDRDRLGAELVGLLEETQASPTGGIRLPDAASLGWLVTRRWLTIGAESVPLLFVGVPIGVFAFGAIMSVAGSHFAPWDAFEEVGSTTPLAVTVRAVVDRILPIALVLSLLTGARAVQYLRRGSYQLPAAMMIASLVTISQHQIFLERTEWAFKDDLSPSSVDQVSPYSVLLLGLALAVPLGFLGIDLLLSTRSRRDPLPPFALKTSGPLLLGLTAVSLVAVPFLVPAMVPFIWMTNLSRRTKVLTTVLTLALLAWVGAVVFYLDD